MKFDKGKIVFIHIPRTAGSYIEDKLCDKYNCKKKWPEPNKENLFGLYKVKDYNYLTLQHLTLNEMIKYEFIEKNIENQFIFTIIRNPYDRVLSLYKNWFKAYKTFDIFLDKLVELNLDKYEHNGIETNNINFNSRNMTSNISEIKYFVLPQYYYINNNEDYKVNIIKYDEMESLNDILKLNVKFNDHSNNNFTDIQKDKIYTIYKIDFDKFNFLK
uniref:Sulfotransferase domain-containing protein n=1 Tax=viral metagenome TaxID=1070528 RepID=A0A6C0BT36_9ZZZZ